MWWKKDLRHAIGDPFAWIPHVFVALVGIPLCGNESLGVPPTDIDFEGEPLFETLHYGVCHNCPKQVFERLLRLLLNHSTSSDLHSGTKTLA